MRRRAMRLCGAPRKYALLIGVGKYAELPSLQGPPHDVRRLKEVLIARYGFEGENIIDLIDERATRQDVLDGFAHLNEEVLRGDVVLIYFSGHAAQGSMTRYFARFESVTEAYLMYDTSLALENVIMADEFHDLISRSPTWKKNVILDLGHGELVRLAEEAGTYTLFTSTSSGEIAWEGVYDSSEESHVASLFTHHFIQRLWPADPRSITAGEMLDAVTADMRGKRGSRVKGV